MNRPVPAALRVSDLRVTFGREAGRASPGAGHLGAGAPRPTPAGLVGVTLEVGAGERLVLVGASGAGKTTLLRAVAGLVPIDEGRIEIGGTDVTRLPPERRGAVYLHQSPVLFPHLTVEENVAFPLRIRGVPRGEARRRVQEVLAAVRLAELGHRPSAALSGGQRHRVALARAVVAGPSLLLLDEPLSSLDPSLRQEIRDVIVQLQERAQAEVRAQVGARDEPGLVLVTHDLEEAGLLGHRVGIVMDGGLAQMAPPEELFRAPATLEVARFLGYRNELSCASGSAVEAWLFGEPGRDGPGPLPATGVTGVTGAKGGEAGKAGRTDGPRNVVVLPPGSVRIVSPASPAAEASPAAMAPGGSSAERRGDPWIRLSGRLLHLAHPGPRPLARVEVDLPGAPPAVLEAEVETAATAGTASSFEPGSRVEILVDPSRVLRF